jgi:hypothetical protein
VVELSCSRYVLGATCTATALTPVVADALLIAATTSDSEPLAGVTEPTGTPSEFLISIG